MLQKCPYQNAARISQKYWALNSTTILLIQEIVFLCLFRQDLRDRNAALLFVYVGNLLKYLKHIISKFELI